MKKLILAIAILFSVTAQAQTVATESLTNKGHWKFGGQSIVVQHINDTIDNKVVTTTWNFWDTVNHVIVKTDRFVHSDTAFNTFWDNYDGFYSLYDELRAKENLPPGDSSKIEDLFYNKKVPNTNKVFRKPPFLKTN